jgi:hypothetical protein
MKNLFIKLALAGIEGFVGGLVFGLMLWFGTDVIGLSDLYSTGIGVAVMAAFLIREPTLQQVFYDKFKQES